MCSLLDIRLWNFGNICITFQIVQIICVDYLRENVRKQVPFLPVKSKILLALQLDY